MAEIIEPRPNHRRKHPQRFTLRVRVRESDYDTLKEAAADWPAESYKLRLASVDAEGQHYVDIAYHACGANRTDVRNRMRDSGLTEVTGGTMRLGTWRATSNGATERLCDSYGCRSESESCRISDDQERRNVALAAAIDLEREWRGR